MSMNAEYEGQCVEACKPNRLDSVVQNICKTGYEQTPESELEELVAASPSWSNKTQQELEQLRDKLRLIPRKDDKKKKQLEEILQHLEWRKKTSGGQEFLKNSRPQLQQQQHHHHHQQPQGAMKQSDRMQAHMQAKAAGGRLGGMASVQPPALKGAGGRPSLTSRSHVPVVMGRRSSEDAAAGQPPGRGPPQRAAQAAAGGQRAKELHTLGSMLGAASQPTKPPGKLGAFLGELPVNEAVEKYKCATCRNSLMRKQLQLVATGDLRCERCWKSCQDTKDSVWPGETQAQTMWTDARGRSQTCTTRIGRGVPGARARVADGKVMPLTTFTNAVAAGAATAIGWITGASGSGKPTGQAAAAAAAAAGGAAGTRKRSGGARDGPIELGDTDDEDEEEGGAAGAGTSAGAAAALAPRRSGRTTTPTNPSQRYAGFKALYPPGGGRSAVQVLADDLDRLEEMEFLNDTIIDYYMRVLEEELKEQEGGDRFYFFNSFFYKKLSEKTGARAGTPEHWAKAYERVKKWTKGVDIFAKDFLFIPIHDALHWSLIIVCHPGQLARSSRAGTPQPAAAAAAVAARPKAGMAASAEGTPGQRKRKQGPELPLTPEDLLHSSSSGSSGGPDVVLGDGHHDSDEEDDVLQVHPAPVAGRGGSGGSGGGRGGGKAVAVDMFSVPTACILHLDSMSDGHRITPLCKDIRAYLEQEFSHKQAKTAEGDGEAEEDGNGSSRAAQQQSQQCGEQSASLPQQWSQEHQGERLRVTDKNLPQRKLHELPRQDNHCDCGLFVLTYTEYFTYAMLQPQFSINVGDLRPNGYWVVKPHEAQDLQLPFPHFMRKRWFAPVIASHLRAFLQYRIFDLMLQQAPRELQGTSAYQDMQQQKQELERLMNSQIGYTTRYLRPLDWAANAADIYAQMDKEETERAERNRNKRTARAAARQQQQQEQQQGSPPEELRDRCGAAAEKRAAAKKASGMIAQLAVEQGPDEDAISSSSGPEHLEAPNRRRKKRKSQQLDSSDDEQQQQQQQQQAAGASPGKRQRAGEAGFHMAATGLSDSQEEEEAIDMATDTSDAPSPEADPEEKEKQQQLLRDLYEELGEAELAAVLQGHHCSPRREQVLLRVLAPRLPVGAIAAEDSSFLVDALRQLLGDAAPRLGTRHKGSRKRSQHLGGGGSRRGAAAKRRKGSKQRASTPAGPTQLDMRSFTNKQQQSQGQQQQQQDPDCPYAEQQQGEGMSDGQQEDSLRPESVSGDTSDTSDTSDPLLRDGARGVGPYGKAPTAALAVRQLRLQQQALHEAAAPVQVEVMHATSQAAPASVLKQGLVERLAEEGGSPPQGAAPFGAAAHTAAAEAAVAGGEAAADAVDLISEDEVGSPTHLEAAAAGACNSAEPKSFAAHLQAYQDDRQPFYGLPPPGTASTGAGRSSAAQHREHRGGMPQPQQYRIGYGGRRGQASSQAPSAAAAGNQFSGFACGGGGSGVGLQQQPQQQQQQQHSRQRQQQQQQMTEDAKQQRMQERQAAQSGTHPGRSRKQLHVPGILGSPQARARAARGQQAGRSSSNNGRQMYAETAEEVAAELGDPRDPQGFPSADIEPWEVEELSSGSSQDGDPESLPKQQQQQQICNELWPMQGSQQAGAQLDLMAAIKQTAPALQLQRDGKSSKELGVEAAMWHLQEMEKAKQQQIEEGTQQLEEARQQFLQQAQQQPAAQANAQATRRNPMWQAQPRLPYPPACEGGMIAGGGFPLPTSRLRQPLPAAAAAATHPVTQQPAAAQQHAPRAVLQAVQQLQQHMQLPPPQQTQWRHSQTSTSGGDEVVDLCAAD